MPRICRLFAALILFSMTVNFVSGQDDAILGKTRDEWLTILQKDEKPRMRKAAVLALGIYGPGRKEVLPVLIRSLSAEKEDDIRLQVVTTMYQLNPRAELRDALGALADVLKDDKSAAVRASSAALIGNLGENAKPALGILIASLKDADAGVRAAAAEAIGKIGSDAKEALNPLLPLLKDPEVPVRTAALFAYARFGTDAALVVPDLLLVLEKDTVEEVRREAVRSLIQVGGTSTKLVVPSVLKALESERSHEVRRQLALSLAKFGDLRSVSKELFERLRDDKDRAVRLYLVRSIPIGLGESFKDHVKEFAECLSKEPEHDVRLAMIQELGALGTAAKDALDALTLAESDVVLQVREAAKEAVLAVKGIAKKEPKK